MQVGFAGDDRTGRAQPLDEPGVLGRVAVEIAIEADAASGGRVGQIEAVFDGDGQAPESVAAIAEWAVFRSGHGFRARGFGESPSRVLPEIGIAAGVLVGALEGLMGQSRGKLRSIGQGGAKAADGPSISVEAEFHSEIVCGENGTELISILVSARTVGHAKFEYGSCFYRPAHSDRQTIEGGWSGGRAGADSGCRYRRQADGRDRGIYGSVDADAAAKAVRGIHC